LKKIWLYSVRSYIKLGLFFYFRSVYVHGVNSIPKDKPVLFLANHQNALLDALLIATQSNRFLFFLTRAGVFNNKIISKLLSSFQMLPVYRVRDGWNNLSNNSAIFNTCSKLFSKKEAVVIFPEGNHNLKRTVRPLSKGFTRIIFETFEKYPDTELLLIPVGLNYDMAEKFPSSISIFYGEAIAAKNFISNDKNQDVLKLKARVQSEIAKLTTHIPSDNYNEILKKLNDLNVDFLKPKNVNKCISSNFDFTASTKKNSNEILRMLFKTLLIITLIGPYIIWKFVVQPKIKDIEFLSTFRFAIAISLVPIWLLILAVILAFNYGSTTALVFIMCVLTLTLLTVKL
jgi:1-acyl-sn-glycerol-3-phosphate acyltransferase